VQYPASASIIISGLAGRQDVVNRLNAQSLRCPNQRFALVGYSQGADVMHRAAERLSTRLYPKILAIAMFGDPNVRGAALSTPFPAALQGKVLQSCAERDPVSRTSME
jgi:cutinase